MTFEIPTFKPGQRVKVDMAEYESGCPNCGIQNGGYGPEFQGAKAPYEFAVVRIPVSQMRCLSCDFIFTDLKGFYSIVFDDEARMAVPWTRLQAIE